MDSRPSKKLKLSSISFSKTVELVVGSGPKQVQLFVLPSILSSKSGYFQGALNNSDWMKVEQKVTLTDEDPETFSIFLAWLHTGDISAAEAFIECTDEKTDLVIENPDAPEGTDVKHQPPLLHTRQFEQLVSCYLLGDFLLAPDFKNTVINMLLVNARSQAAFSQFIAGGTNSIVSKVYRGTKAKDPLRLLLLDIFKAQTGSSDSTFNSMMEGELNERTLWQVELSKELTVVLHGALKRSNTSVISAWERPVCGRYHQHPGEPKGFNCETWKESTEPEDTS